MSMLRQTLLLIGKDVTLELRARELLYATCLFGVLVVLVFAFSLGPEQPPASVISAVLWVAMALAGTVGLGRAFEREREGDTLGALLLSPVSRVAVYVSKLVAMVLLMSVVELVSVLLVALIFHAQLAGIALPLALLVIAGSIGFGAVAALFGAGLGRAGARELLLPILVYPLTIPVLIAGTRGTTLLLVGDPDGTASFWLKFMVVFDAVFLSLGTWLFEPLVEGGA